ncbi:MAG TPA: PSD1 and planctomycete cytochrome C domain-containing protein [Tepidisphaeraceae bacterium]|nr:PSD1 and planctomycete cytochrome C domain-containing protein [Tepidisphaeraceae bacterium]
MRLVPLLAIVLLAPAASAAPATREQLDFFEKRIRPVLVGQCYKCHSHAGEKVKANLLLDSREALLKGGDTGPAIVPGKSTASLLMTAIRGTKEDLQMPPKSKLSDAVVADFATWIDAGAPWPAETRKDAAGATAAAQASEYDRLERELWSWQPITDPAAPAVKNAAWAKSDIDRFVLARLEQGGLTPAVPADKLALLRRLSFDLTGLPPSPAEIEAFVRDTSPSAVETVVDRLLASPAFGERWGRHWLDVARYAESSGMTRNFVYRYAWRYRDYVIRAFNEDKPFDRFVAEQLAGDLLPARSVAEKDLNTIATGFLCVGPRDYVERNPRQSVYNSADEMIDTVGRAFLATTIACARCHDHKFDPIPTSEYYALAGIFVSSDEQTGIDRRRRGAANRLDQYDDDELIPLAGYKPDPKKAKSDDDTKTEAREAFRSFFSATRYGGGDFSKPNKPVKFLAMGVKDDRPADVRVLNRGEITQPGDSVRRGFVSIPAIKNPPTISPGQSGRRELAQWVTSAENPLTARVMANRVWAHLFGAGLVRSVDNFGTTGDKPTHPELLDHLATRFVKDGWSVKRLIKSIVLTSTYQQSAAFDKAKFERDPENHLLWRQNQRRLEAEAIRDAMLAVSGQINPTPPTASIAIDLPNIPLGVGGARFNPAELVSSTTHRSVYLPILRNLTPESLDVFDFADNANVTGQRDVTTVPPQALYVMNSPFVIRLSRAMTDRVAGAGLQADPARIDYAYKLALGRPATPVEKDRAAAYLQAFLRDPKAATSRDPYQNKHAAWSSLCQALMASAEFRYLN